MRRTLCVVPCLALAMWSLAAADPLPVPDDGPFPKITGPTPKVDADAIPTLTEGVYYVVYNNAPFLIYSSPPGLVTIVKEAGPIRLRGIFIDGSGRIETKTYNQKYLAFVEVVPGSKGSVELIYQLEGAKDEKLAIRKMVNVNTAPLPPPKPPTPPMPPIDPVDPLLVVLQAAYDAEPVTATRTSDRTQLAAVFRALAMAVTDPRVKTGDDNFALINNSIQSSIDGRLKTKLRPAIGAEINKILPNGPGKGTVALTIQNRADAAALYLRVATLLDQLKN